MMNRNRLLFSFAISFAVTFVAGFALLLALGSNAKNDGGGSMMAHMASLGDLPPWNQLLLLAEVSGLVSVLFSAYNAWENHQIAQSYQRDISNILKNESPENPELTALSEQLVSMRAELQKLSADSTQARARIIEEERKRFARELHDSVSQELFAATMILSSVEASAASPEQMQSQAQLTLKILHEAQNEMRALLLHLRPTELDGKTLVDGLRALIEELQTKISCTINYQLTEIATTQTVEDNLFRMAQEILSNTLRHSQAKNIDVQLQETANAVVMRIRDDGIGFTLEKSDKTASYGLKNLRERAVLLGGNCTITTAPNAGTLVEIHIPKLKEN
ncbi:MAG: sensor histidine kinase [Streptococcaceae bacterium]|jgi:NarL family two-component system sensor histidine kinase LiaS|nr:sensor histidine kinase [Streptococcaceae bacterium]